MDISEQSGGVSRQSSAGRPLAGQAALVTGANSGIGMAVATAMAAAGAAVAVNYVVGDDEARAVAEQITNAGGKAIAVKADVSDENQVAAMFDQAIAAFGTLDIVVANAGLQRDAPLADMTLAQWNTVIGVNLTGQFLCARAAVREFLRRGRRPEISRALGKIICMSSVHEVIPWAGHANYAASKGGVMMLMKTIAQELAPQGHSRQRAGARRHPHADQHSRLVDAGSLRSPDAAGTLPAHRRAKGRRPRRHLARVRRQRLRQRRDVVRRRRHDPLSRVCHRRLKCRRSGRNVATLAWAASRPDYFPRPRRASSGADTLSTGRTGRFRWQCRLSHAAGKGNETMKSEYYRRAGR